MRVRRQTHRGKVSDDSYLFLVYDETIDSTESDAAEQTQRIRQLPLLPGDNRQKFEAKVLESLQVSERHLYGKAYGHPHLSYFRVWKDGTLEFEFDGSRHYSDCEVKQLFRLAAAAKRRCKFA